jgi:hypothetical protein
MKLKILGLVGGAAALALASTTASADTDVSIGLDLGVRAPVYVEREPARHYHHEPAPVVYYEYYDPYPRRYVYQSYDRHDDGWRHKHKAKHKHKHRHHR